MQCQAIQCRAFAILDERQAVEDDIVVSTSVRNLYHRDVSIERWAIIMRHFPLHRLQLLWLAFTVGLLPSMVSAAPKLAPFQATINFTEQVRFPTDPSSPCLLLGTISGLGTATKIDPVYLASTDCIVPLSPTVFLFSSQQVVLTDPNGQQIWATYGGTLSAETGVISGLYFIHGGTGRYATAVGAGTISGFESLNPATGGTGQIQLRGTLSY